MKPTACILLLLVALALMASAQVFGGGPIAAPVQYLPATYNFGMVGIAPGQAMRVVASNVGSETATTPQASAPTCGVQVKFFDANGDPVGQNAQIDSLTLGKSFSNEISAPAGVARAEFRAQVQVTVTQPAGTMAPMRFAACNMIATLQVYDQASGKTDLILVGNLTNAVTPFLLGMRSLADTPQ